MDESGVTSGLSFGVSIGITVSRGAYSWRDFWRGLVTLLLILAAFALGTLALDTFGWSLPLGSYLMMWAVMIPTVALISSAHILLARRHARHRRGQGLRAVAVEKQ